MRFYYLSLILSFLWLMPEAYAQKVISGKVSDAENGAPVVGANIVLKGTSEGTITDVDGNYTISASDDVTHILVSFVGYETQEIEIAGQTTINVSLKADVKMLEELVVVGYGVQNKSDVTGAIASVSSEELNKAAVASVEQALQGRAAGVQITANSGDPGGGIQVRIRGVGTVNNADPLYVVDGFPILGGIGYLNPADIASIEVLKDASASAIYGARAANGVVLVTTKKGAEGKATITYDFYYGSQSVWKTPDLLDGPQWIQAMTDARNRGQVVDPNETPFTLSAPADNPNQTTDWFGEITQSAPMQSHTVSMSGGSEKSKYYMSAGYLKQDGVVKNSSYDRLTVRLNGDHKVGDRLVVGTNLSVRNSQRHIVPEGIYHGAMNAAQKLDPLTPSKDADGVWVSSPYSDINNVVGTIERANLRTNLLRVSGSAFAELEIIEGLKFKSNFGIDLFRDDTYDFTPNFELSPDEREDRNSVRRAFSRTNNYLWENTLAYTKTFADKHNISVIAGITRQENRTENLDVTRFDTPSNQEDFWYISAATDDSPQASGTASEWAMLSYLGRINYAYADKYLLTASIRQDGSSKFGPNNRYGTFPSFSAGWRIINESFMSGISDKVLSDLKIRAGWGQIGNSEIPEYQYATSYQSLGRYNYVLGVGADEQSNIGVGPTSIGNTNIQWETVESSNIGVDAAFLSNRLTATVEYFVKNTKDMLLVQPVPNYIGYNSTTGGSIAPFANLGEVKNSGIELTLNWDHQVSNDFSYNVGFNLTSIQNEVVSLGGGALEFMAGGSFQPGATTRTEIGQPIGAFYGYVMDGLFQTQADVDAWYQPNAIPGDIRFKDLNNDGVINDDDRQSIGSPFPDFSYGINLSAEYKGFDISLFFQGVQGNEIFNGMRYYSMSGGFPYNKHQDVLKAWNGAGSSNEIPVLNSKDANNNFRVSDFYIEDGSYMRLRNMQIGYSLPQSMLEKAKLGNVRVYVSGQNLLTFTGYTGLDPEIGQRSTTSYLSNGLDVGTYPQARTVMVGANISF